MWWIIFLCVMGWINNLLRVNKRTIRGVWMMKWIVRILIAIPLIVIALYSFICNFTEERLTTKQWHAIEMHDKERLAYEA